MSVKECPRPPDCSQAKSGSAARVRGGTWSAPRDTPIKTGAVGPVTPERPSSGTYRLPESERVADASVAVG